MRSRLSFTVVVLCLSSSVGAQPATSNAPAAAATSPAGKDFRDVSGYPFPALARTRGHLQNVATAIQLREYCADDKLDAAFVRRQLERFSRITGRSESCRTLLDY
jgi:hypothetical protein